MRILILLPILALVGCTTTNEITSSTVHEIGNSVNRIGNGLLSIPKSLIGQETNTQTSNDGWVWAVSIPKDNPTKQIFINKPSITRVGNKVSYQSKLKFLGNSQYLGNYKVQDGDYILATTVFECGKQTFGTYGSKLYSKNGQYIGECPENDKSNMSMNSVGEGTIISRIYQAACH